jgi:putative component of toxin-antitoxin plasmid stabilization module
VIDLFQVVLTQFLAKRHAEATCPVHYLDHQPCQNYGVEPVIEEGVDDIVVDVGKGIEYQLYYLQVQGRFLLLISAFRENIVWLEKVRQKYAEYSHQI